MRYRLLGRTGLRVSELFLGAMTFTDAADELGATPSQVAIAWIRSRSPAVVPVLGAGTVEQLTDNLGAADLVLPDEVQARLTDAAPFHAGFPADFIAECEAQPGIYGDAFARLDGRP